MRDLAEGGRLVIPVGPPSAQTLEVHRRRGDRLSIDRRLAVRFVPMLGQTQEPPSGSMS